MDIVKGVIFNIQGYSIHDGPGIRTLVFLKGCPLRCLWCDNPESQSPHVEVEFFQDKCIKCGKCLTVCEQDAINKDLSCKTEEKIDRSLCNNCLKCAGACTTQALSQIGEVYTVSQLMQKLLKDAPFWRKSGGGVTLSGGDPLRQPRFARALLQELYDRNINTTLETMGYAPRKTFRSVIELADLILFDIKHIDDDTHKKLTGVSNKLILENLKEAIKMGKSVIIRVPSIPTYNLTTSNITATVKVAKEQGICEIHFMPFHQLGKDKYSRLGQRYQLGHLNTLSYDDPMIKEAIQIAQSHGLKAQAGG